MLHGGDEAFLAGAGLKRTVARSKGDQIESHLAGGWVRPVHVVPRPGAAVVAPRTPSPVARFACHDPAAGRRRRRPTHLSPWHMHDAIIAVELVMVMGITPGTEKLIR